MVQRPLVMIRGLEEFHLPCTARLAAYRLIYLEKKKDQIYRYWPSCFFCSILFLLSPVPVSRESCWKVDLICCLHFSPFLLSLQRKGYPTKNHVSFHQCFVLPYFLILHRPFCSIEKVDPVPIVIVFFFSFFFLNKYMH